MEERRFSGQDVALTVASDDEIIECTEESETVVARKSGVLKRFNSIKKQVEEFDLPSVFIHRESIPIAECSVIASSDCESSSDWEYSSDLQEEGALNKVKELIRIGDDASEFARQLSIIQSKNDSKILCKILYNAVKKNRTSCVRELLKFELNVVEPVHEYSSFAVACKKGFPEILELLLGKINKDNKEQLKEPLLYFVVKKMISVDNGMCVQFHKCFDILLDNQFINVNEQYKLTGDTVVHVANRSRNEEIITKLLNKSPQLGITNRVGRTALQLMSPKLLESFLDSRISTNKKLKSYPDYAIILDFTFLKPSREDAGEMAPLHYMSQTREMHHLLRHPVISSFLLIKWDQIRLAFYLNFFIFAIYSISLITYFLLFYGVSKQTAMHKTLKGLCILGWLCVALREIAQMAINRRKYFRSRTNWFEMFMLSFTAYFLFVNTDFDRRHGWAALVIWLAGVEFTLLLNDLPLSSIVTHLAMLKRVSINFMKSFAFYSVHIFIFAMSFYAIFREDKITDQTMEEKDNSTETSQFRTFPLTIIKVLAMFTGELEASDYDFNRGAVAYILFVLFVLFITIVLMNLLNGLAVNDTQEIRAESENNILIQRAIVLNKYDIFIKKYLRLEMLSTKKHYVFVNQNTNLWAGIQCQPKSFQFEPDVLNRITEILNERESASNKESDLYDRKCMEEILAYINQHCRAPTAMDQ